MRLLSYNIKFGGRGRERFIANVIRSANPDVVILQEATHPAIVEQLANISGLTYWAARAGFSLAFMSRRPTNHYSWHHTKWLKHSFLELDIHNFPVRIFGVHLRPHYSKWNEYRRVQELKSILDIIDNNKAAVPHLMVGDFNAVAPGDIVYTNRMPIWIRLLIRISGGQINREAINVLLRYGYVDGFKRLYPYNNGFTFPTSTPNVRIDYLFLSAHVPYSIKECFVLNSGLNVLSASDHYPLMAIF